MFEKLIVVAGAASTRDILPVLQHLAFAYGRVHAFDGRVHLCGPAPPPLVMLNCTVPAEPLVRAITNLEGEVQFSLEESTLLVRGAGTTIRLPTGPLDAFPIGEPPAPLPKKAPKLPPLIPLLTALRPFVGDDADRPWVSSVWFTATRLLVTNNVILAGTIAPWGGPWGFELPVFAVDQLMRLALEPLAVRTADPMTVEFLLPGGLWLRTARFAAGWPPSAEGMIPATHAAGSLTPLPPGLRSAVQRIVPFCPDPKVPVVTFAGDTVSTLDGHPSATVTGLTRLNGESFEGLGRYRAEPLEAVLSVATAADWSQYPRVPWAGISGDIALEGVLLGVAP